LLTIATEQEENLSLESVSLSVSVEIAEKRVLLKDLKEKFGIKFIPYKASQGGLAHPDGPFNGNVKVPGQGILLSQDEFLVSSAIVAAKTTLRITLSRPKVKVRKLKMRPVAEILR
jgi:hypothetical protein